MKQPVASSSPLMDSLELGDDRVNMIASGEGGIDSSAPARM
jgi:hypothetical protein